MRSLSRPPGGPFRASLLIASSLAVVATPAPAQAQESNSRSVSVDSAAAIRASLNRPPPKPTTDAVEVLETPFRLAFVPVRWAFETGAALVGFVTRPEPAAPARGILEARRWGLDPRIQTIGPRSGPAIDVELARFPPFFVQTGISILGSQRHGAGAILGDASRGLRLAYTWRRDAQDHFWGVGGDSREELRSDFLREKQEAGARGWARLGRFFRVSGGVAFEDNRVDRGFDGGLPDLQDTFGADSLFGVGQRTQFVRLDLATTLDLTGRRRLQRRGLWLSVRSSVFRGVDGTDSDFHRFTGELRGYLPVSSGQMFAVRALTEVNELDDGEGIPFFDLSRLGGGRNGPRGFGSGRFRDRAGLSLMAEWRYEIWEDVEGRNGVQGFLFFDEGGVESSLGSLTGSDLHASYGLGVRLESEGGLLGLVYLAFSEEGPLIRLRTDVSF